MVRMSLFGKKRDSSVSATFPPRPSASDEGLGPETPVLESTVKLKIPRIIRRNTLKLATSQAFVGTGTQLITALGALAILQLTHSATLTGLGTAIIAVSRFVISYPAGKISDLFGRKPALAIGIALGIVGAPLIGVSILLESFALLLVGFLIFSLGMGMTQQLRVAAADMYPPSHRGVGTGYVLMGSLLGALMAPGIIELAQQLSPGVGVDPLGMPWFFVPMLTVPALFLVLSIRPDPREIAKNLADHYPGHLVSSKSAPATQAEMSPRRLLRYYPTLAALVSSMAAQGNMAMMMFITSLALQSRGFDLAAISVSVSIHVIGMFGFTVPLGRMADKFGRRFVLLAGVAVAGAGSMLVPYSPSYFVITTGTFLVGLGWSAVYVAATALIADTCPPEVRGRAVGFNDTFGYVPGIVLPLLAGPVAAGGGLVAVGWLGMLIMLPAFIVLLYLREPRPGKYSYGASPVAAK
jgi:MFS family permease